MIACERLQRLDRFGVVLGDERDADRPPPRLHRHAGPQPLVQGLLRRGQVRVRQLVVFRTADRRDEHARPVDRDLELMRPLQSRHVADDVLDQADVEFVLGVEREVVMEQDSAARANG